jgi:hypothetical protein
LNSKILILFYLSVAVNLSVTFKDGKTTPFSNSPKVWQVFIDFSKFFSGFFTGFCQFFSIFYGFFLEILMVF